jgi:hypothetical protein
MAKTSNSGSKASVTYKVAKTSRQSGKSNSSQDPELKSRTVVTKSKTSLTLRFTPMKPEVEDLSTSTF